MVLGVWGTCCTRQVWSIKDEEGHMHCIGFLVHAEPQHLLLETLETTLDNLMQTSDRWG